MAHVNSKDMFPIIVTPMAAMKYKNSDSSRHQFQDICPPISQIVLKNFIKISLIVKNVLKKFLQNWQLS